MEWPNPPIHPGVTCAGPAAADLPREIQDRSTTTTTYLPLNDQQRRHHFSKILSLPPLYLPSRIRNTWYLQAGSTVQWSTASSWPPCQITCVMNSFFTIVSLPTHTPGRPVGGGPWRGMGDDRGGDAVDRLGDAGGADLTHSTTWATPAAQTLHTVLFGRHRRPRAYAQYYLRDRGTTNV